MATNDISLKTYLAGSLHVPEVRVAPIAARYAVRQLDKQQFVLRAGEICRHTFFVERGLLRQYAIDGRGREHIVALAPEGWFVADRASTYFHEPSEYFIQALEDTRVVLVDESLVTSLADEWPEFVGFNNRLLHNNIRTLQRRVTSLLGTTAEERYLEFVETYPDVLSRVPQTMVAFYLGITPETLSRVRRELAKKGR